jgi:hypothetical protein
MKYAHFKMGNLALAGFVLLSTTASGYAQSILRMDNAGCIGGLEDLAKLVKVEIKPATSPRKVIGKCDAQSVDVVAERAGVTLTIGRLTWNRNGLVPLSDGQLPDQLQLEMRGVKVTNAPANDPAWNYLVDYGRSGRAFDATLDFAFQADKGVLELAGAMLDFHNGNSARLSGRLRGVTPAFPKSPEIGIFPLIIDNLTIAINSRDTRKNPLLELGVAMLKGKIPNGDIDGFRSLATLYIATELSKVMGGNDLASVNRLVSDLPDPKGDLLLHLTAAKGYPVLRFGLWATGRKLAQMLEGVSVEAGYSPNLFDAVN